MSDPRDPSTHPAEGIPPIVRIPASRQESAGLNLLTDRPASSARPSTPAAPPSGPSGPSDTPGGSADAGGPPPPPPRKVRGAPGPSRSVRTLQNVLAAVAAVLLGVTALLYGLWLYLFSGLQYDENGTIPSGYNPPTRIPTHVVPTSDDIVNILLLGSDSRDPDEEYGLSDVMMIMTVDRRHGTLKLASIMRDTLVYIPGVEAPKKINHANAFGGPALAMRTVNEAFNLDIRKYALVDMRSAGQLIDLVGGVLIDVREEEIRYLNDALRYQQKAFPDDPKSPFVETAGLQRLDGSQAVAYARIRKLDSDYARTGRQRTVVAALFRSFREVDVIRKAQMVQKGFSFVRTNISPSDLTFMALDVLPLLGNEVKETRIPFDGTFHEVTSGDWHIETDFEALIPLLQDFIWEERFPFDPRPTLPGARPKPTSKPTSSATPEPTPVPTSSATPESTPVPTPEPTPESTPSTSPEPSPEGTPTPGGDPTATPVPTTEPTPQDTPTPGGDPTPSATPP